MADDQATRWVYLWHGTLYGVAKGPCIAAGHTQPPFLVTRPDTRGTVCVMEIEAEECHG